MARQSPNGRPIVGNRLNDTVAVVQKGIRPPPAVYELHYGPSAEAMVTTVESLGTKPSDSVSNSSPDKGNTMSRAVDYMRRMK